MKLCTKIGSIRMSVVMNRSISNPFLKAPTKNQFAPMRHQDIDIQIGKFEKEYSS